MIVTATDCLRCGFCPKGIHDWCKTHGIDTRLFLKHGIESEKVIEIGDAFGLRAVTAAERRIARGK